MKCKSCKENINPQWKNATETNVCPFCGGSIMDSDLKDLLTTMRALLDNIGEYESEVNDWLLSNYKLIKTDSPDLVNYLSEDDSKKLINQGIDKAKKDLLGKKLETSKTLAVSEDDSKILDERTSEFFERAQVIKKGQNPSDKTQRIKSLVEQIKGDSSMQEEYIKETDISEDLDSPLEDYIPEHVLKLAEASKSSASNAKDLLRLNNMISKAERTQSGDWTPQFKSSR